MHTNKGLTGITEVEFQKYGIDFYVRSKYIEELRATEQDFKTMHTAAVTLCAMTNNALIPNALPTAFTATETAIIAATIQIKTSTPRTVYEGCGAIQLHAFMTTNLRFASAERFGYTTLKVANKGLTDLYKTLFINTAESYEFAYVSGS